MSFFTSRLWGSLIRPSGLGRRRAHRALSRSRWTVAALEQLETRIVPAGVANVTFAAGTLTITAVDDLTPAGITGGLNNQSVQLNGGGAGIVSVVGNSGTTLTGAVGTFNGVTAEWHCRAF